MSEIALPLGNPKGGPGFTHEAPGGGKPDWYTPAWVFEAMGVTFDLDPCHPIQRLPWVPAREVMTIETDGLKTPWPKGAFVWLNPPYGKETPRWLAKLYQEGNGVALLFARTDTDWFHAFIAQASAILFLSSRVRFVDATGKPPLGKDGKPSSPGCGSMLVAFGARGVGALKNFERARGGMLITGWSR